MPRPVATDDLARLKGKRSVVPTTGNLLRPGRAGDRPPDPLILLCGPSDAEGTQGILRPGVRG